MLPDMSDGKRTSTGVLFALCSIFIVQIGAAASTPVFALVGPAGTAWLRLCWAAVIFVAVARPSLRALRRRDLAAAVLLGVVSAGMTITFFQAIDRIPLATAVAIEFLGPLGRRAAPKQPLGPGLAAPAFAGVLLVTQPWSGLTDPIGIAFALGAGAAGGVHPAHPAHRAAHPRGGRAGDLMPAAAIAATPVDSRRRSAM
jgi:inner membrane transporter RhtA